MTLEGSLGRSRDQRTRTSPIFAKYSRPFDRKRKPVRASRKDCRLSLLDFIRGRPVLRPLRCPVHEAKKFRNARRESLTDCTNATLDTSANHARCSVFLATVMTCRWISLSDNVTPAWYAYWRTRRASLNTTRQHPNTQAKTAVWSGVGSIRYLYRLCTPPP